MVTYNVRSRKLIDLINEIKAERLLMAPYFQRKRVWRKIHKIDFIKTILGGYPFPEIFISDGDLDVDRMETTSCIVDGQQRMSSIIEYISNELEVDGKLYKELLPEEKEKMLRYQIAVIELEVKYNDPEIQEIFKRLNRTFYSLSNIEKTSSEYGACEFMLIAKLLSKELPLEEYKNGRDNIKFDPNITSEFISWAREAKIGNFNKLIIDTPIFSGYELSRQVHLNYVLNIIGIIDQGFYNRNIKKDILEEYSEEYPAKTELVTRLEKVASIILKIKLKKNSYWYYKSNMFSLIIAIYNNLEKIDLNQLYEVKNKLIHFEKETPDDYKMAAKEGVNNKKERLLRNEYIENLLFSNDL